MVDQADENEDYNSYDGQKIEHMGTGSPAAKTFANAIDPDGCELRKTPKDYIAPAASVGELASLDGNTLIAQEILNDQTMNLLKMITEQASIYKKIEYSINIKMVADGCKELSSPGFLQTLRNPRYVGTPQDGLTPLVQQLKIVTGTAAQEYLKTAGLEEFAADLLALSDVAETLGKAQRAAKINVELGRDKDVKKLAMPARKALEGERKELLEGIAQARLPGMSQLALPGTTSERG